MVDALISSLDLRCLQVEWLRPNHTAAPSAAYCSPGGLCTHTYTLIVQIYSKDTHVCIQRHTFMCMQTLISHKQLCYVRVNRFEAIILQSLSCSLRNWRMNWAHNLLGWWAQNQEGTGIQNNEQSTQHAFLVNLVAAQILQIILIPIFVWPDWYTLLYSCISSRDAAILFFTDWIWV